MLSSVPLYDTLNIIFLIIVLAFAYKRHTMVMNMIHILTVLEISKNDETLHDVLVDRWQTFHRHTSLLIFSLIISGSIFVVEMLTPKSYMNYLIIATLIALFTLYRLYVLESQLRKLYALHKLYITDYFKKSKFRMR